MINQYRVFQIKEVHHQHWAKSYAQQVENGFLIHHQNYQSAYKGKPAPSDTPMTARKRLEEKRPNTFVGRSFGVGDVIVWDEEKERKFFYVDKEELVEFGGFMDADAAGNTVVYMVPNYQIDGKTGTWLPYDSEVVEGVCFFMMRNEQRKDTVSPIVVDSKGVFVTDAPNGFENVRAVLAEYVHRAEKKQQDMTEHEKCLTNGTYERARESGTEQNYDMIDIKSGKINCIIVKDLSRLGRNYIEMGKYLEQIFPMMGIRFIAINDNYDNANTESSDSDSIVVPFKNLLNDSYCRDISIKVRSQLDMKRRKGEFIGGYAIYGYCKDERNKNRLVVDEYAADIVRSIYRRKLEGMSAQAIAEQLNSENVLAPSEYKRLCGLNYHSGFKAGTHAKWQAIQVLRILKNEVYTGTMVQGRRQKINYKIKKIRDVEESGWIRVPNMHEAIIPQKLFDTVQEVLKLDTCASKGQQTVNLFSGIVRCGGCGQNMVRRTVSKNGKKYIYLHCVTNHNGLGCSSHLISESKLEEVVLAALQGKIQQISGLEHRLDEINEIPKNERRLKSVEEHLKMLEQEEQKYQTLRCQLYEDMSSGIVSKEEYKEFSQSFNEKVEAIRKAKAEMNRQRDCLNNLDVEHLPWIEDFKSYQNLTSLNRRVLVELVESITVYDKEHIHIQYRFDQEIRNVLEYCSSVPAAETEESAV